MSFSFASAHADGSTYDPIDWLIRIRGQIEHPMPGVIGWDAPTCLDAIAGGVIVAEWALRRVVGKTDDRGLGYFIGQIRERLPGWAQPAAQNGSRAALKMLYGEASALHASSR